MPVYFMRHAQTPGNASNVWVGRKDEALTAAGIKELKSSLNDLPVKYFDFIYSSPLTRAMQTAEIVKAELKLTPDIQIVDELKERDFGYFEGCVKTKKNRIKLDESSQAESMQALARRIAPFFKQISFKQGNHLIISHSAVFRCLTEHLGYASSPLRYSLNNSESVILYEQPEVALK